MLLKVFVFISVIGLVLFICLLKVGLEYRHNKKLFNNGVCLKCGHNLMLIDKNKNGRLYECPNCKRKIYRQF